MMEYTRLKVMSDFSIGNWTESTGHLALLIQQPDDTWAYYSVNGDKIYASTNGLVGGPTNDVGVGSWKSPEEFLKYMNGDSTQDKDGQTEEKTKYEYAEAYEITTTPEQDKIIADEFGRIAKEDYDLASNNCAHAVQRSLNAASIKTSGQTANVKNNNRDKPWRNLTGSSFIKPVPVRYYQTRPADTYNYIRLSNPGGVVHKK